MIWKLWSLKISAQISGKCILGLCDHGLRALGEDQKQNQSDALCISIERFYDEQKTHENGRLDAHSPHDPVHFPIMSTAK